MTSKLYKTALCLSAATGLALSASPAFAQAANETVLEDIIVTARRSEERLQDVPISITVFNQEQLSNRNVVNAKDLATYTPSLTANTRYGSDNTTFTLRGFSQEQRTTATVAVYFADVVGLRGSGSSPGGEGAGPGAFFDLQNVQVLKGPQGTLFGRNTTGGAVLLVPQKPTDRTEGYIEGSYGNYDMRRLQGVANFPVNENVRIRAGFDWQKRDGYLENVSPIGPRDFGDVDYFAGRLSAVVDLRPNLENYTIFSYTTSENNGVLPSLNRCFTGLAASALACAAAERITANGFWTVENNQPDPTSANRQWQLINTTTWEVNDNLTVKNIVSYGEYTGDQRQDLFGTYFPIGGGMHTNFASFRTLPGHHIHSQSTFTEELQFQGRGMEDRLTWQAGGYIELSDPIGKSGNQNGAGMWCPDSDNFQCTGATGSMSRAWTKTKYRDYAAYAQASYDLTEKLKLTAGIRYTADRVRTEAHKWTLYYPTPNNPVVYCVDPSSGPIGPAGPGDYSNGFTLEEMESICGKQLRKNSSAPTWLLDLDYKPIDNVLLYAKWARGYRMGSTAPLAADGNQIYKPEKVDSYEVGAKTSWRGAMPGSFNIAAFYNDFQDQQIQVGFRNFSNNPPPTIGIANVGTSKIFGTEIETRLSPLQGLWLEAQYSYIETELSDVTPTLPSPPYDEITPPIEGSRLPFAPKNKVVLSANYTLPLSEDIGRVSVGATYSYQSSASVGSTFWTFTKAYDTLNLNATWASVMDKPVDISLFATNVTKEKYWTHVNDQATRGFVSYYLGEPRMYGVRLRYRFGE